MLLHVVCPCEFLLAALEGAVNSLFSSMDLRMARCMARSSEGLFTAVRVFETARIPLPGT
jgi:hypothetical protein